MQNVLWLNYEHIYKRKPLLENSISNMAEQNAELCYFVVETYHLVKDAYRFLMIRVMARNGYS